MSVKLIKENKRSGGHADITVFMAVDGKTHSEMLEEAKINIVWNRCAVYDLSFEMVQLQRPWTKSRCL